VANPRTNANKTPRGGCWCGEEEFPDAADVVAFEAAQRFLGDLPSACLRLRSASDRERDRLRGALAADPELAQSLQHDAR
jgi:hypothetical protein